MSFAPFDRPDVIRRLMTLRTLSLGMMLGLAGISGVVMMIVHFALDGLPIAGRLMTVGGVSMVTVVAGVITLIIIPVTQFLASGRVERGLDELAARPRDDHPEGLLDLFAGYTFTCQIVPLMIGFCWAALMHLTADPLMLLWVSFLIGFMIVHYPTTVRAQNWYNQMRDLLAGRIAAKSA